MITGIIAGDDQLSDDARSVARIGLANYFAGALLLPYLRFLEAAEDVRYDIDQLARRFEVGFETICHRLSTLQRPNARGVPFIFVRTDSAGNISKRQSATAFHFSRVGGNCPLWVVHHAFSRPGQFLTQVAQMPDERTYFWVARTTTTEPSRYLGPDKSFAIGLGCDVAHAEKLIYSRRHRFGRRRVDRADRRRLQDLRPARVPATRVPIPRPSGVRRPHSSTDLPYPPAITP